MIKRLLNAASVQAVLSWLVGLYMDFVARTTRWEVEGKEEIVGWALGGPCIVAFWHECLPSTIPILWRQGARHGRVKPGVALASAHRDGRLIGNAVKYFGVGLVLGSSSRGGAAGLRNLVEAMQAGSDVGLTPDGPRGPRRVAAAGLSQLAALTAAPILPAAAWTRWAITVNSWDRMRLPLPFGKGRLICGQMISVPRRGYVAAASGDPGGADGSTRARRGVGMSFYTSAYTGFATLASPILRRLLSGRATRGKEVPERLQERFGVSAIPRPEGRLIWFHAASVGETLSLLPVIEALEGQAEVLLTTGTVTSADLAAVRLPVFARHQFTPLDVPDWVKKFLDHWRPDCAVFVESELWPTILTTLDARGIPRLLINGSLSAGSVKSWRRVAGLAREMLGGFRAVQRCAVGAGCGKFCLAWRRAGAGMGEFETGSTLAAGG